MDLLAAAVEEEEEERTMNDQENTGKLMLLRERSF